MTTSVNDPPEEQFVSDYLLYLLAAASDGASKQFYVEVSARGLRVPEWRVLACLYDRDGEMITRLARLSLIVQSRLTRIIMQMEQRGLVQRQSDPEDGRRVRVYLSEEGRATTNELVPLARIHEEGLLAQLPKAKAKALKPMLRELLNIIESASDVPQN